MSTNFMALTRSFKQIIAERAQRDPAFAQALLDEAATLGVKIEVHAVPAM